MGKDICEDCNHLEVNTITGEVYCLLEEGKPTFKEYFKKRLSGEKEECDYFEED